MRLVILNLLVSVSLFGQSETSKPVEPESILNSFTKAMELTNPSPDQIDSMLRLSYRYLFNNQDTCLSIAKKAVEFSEKSYSNQSIHAQALLQLGDAYRIRSDWDEAEKLYLEGKALYKSLGILGKVANADTKLGALNKDKGNYEIAIKYHLSALETWENLRDTQHIFKPYINISEVFYYLNRLDKAYEYNAKALQIAELKNYVGVKMIALNNQGTLEKEIGDNYNNMADTMPLQSALYRDSAQLFFKKALSSYEESLSVAKEGNNERRVAAFIGSLAELKMAMGDFAGAIKLSKEGEHIAKELGSTEQILHNKIIMAQAYRESGQLAPAVLQAEAGLKLAVDNKMEMEKSRVNDVLYLTYKDLGQYQKALTNYEGYWEYEKKVSDDKKNKSIAEVEGKYQNEHKEKQILEQKNDILELEKSKEKIVRQKNYFIGGATILGILGFLGFQLEKARRERNDKKAFAEALIFAQEEERKRIARDLHDGIGQSLLLIKKQMESTHESTLENREMITETLEEVRSISRDLHPFQLEKFGLTAAIEEAIRKIENSTELFITKEIDNVDNVFLGKSEIHVFRTIQEALSNVVKHADATAANISIHYGGDELIVKVQDNGKGFDHELTIVKSKSLGLRTMYERVSALGGKLKIERGSPNGTIIEIRIPNNSLHKKL